MNDLRPAPKPTTSKKKKKTNGYKDKASRYCHYCGTPGAERHEVYGGASRQTSIDMGFQVDLCTNCHQGWHEQKEELWQDRKKEWQRKYQTEYENKLITAGVTAEQARSCWMALIGKNYT